MIFADADGATKFDELGKLEVELKSIERDGLGIAVGSRAHMVHSAAVVQVSLLHLRIDSIRDHLFAISPCMHFIPFCISLAFGLSRILNADSNCLLVEPAQRFFHLCMLNGGLSM